MWIPVGKIYINENKEYKEIKLGRYTFSEKGEAQLKQSAENYLQEISIGGSTEYVNGIKTNIVAKDLKDFATKANNIGYYIGRFEAGDQTATEERTEESSDTIIPVVKKGIWPYNWVTQVQAANLAREMYKNNTNFQSDLINSYAWDTAVVFIQEFSGDPDYSIKNRFQSEFTTTGNAKDNNNNYDVRCNIYDMAGNSLEWSTETYEDETYFTIARGGSYYTDISYVARRHNSTEVYSFTDYVIRPILYL